ncbi:hypothetical protein FG93_04614 [Bosea sp. LC85]|uniref:hypothetical protein n=1 Tax=Bosea sp. LC85 TaxID=1502851 RepID=UPI0004E30706|nr:hypothetical protein [Bosea sp. LC85]KFC65798.1 hypothetical protein FG93_04614 [Bosea sp. LC85]
MIVGIRIIVPAAFKHVSRDGCADLLAEALMKELEQRIMARTGKKLQTASVRAHDMITVILGADRTRIASL